MMINIPDVTPQQFGQMVLKLSEQPLPGSQAALIVALQTIAQGLVSGALTIAEQPPAHSEGEA